MRIYYNNVPLHDLGRVIISGEGGEGDPPEAPTRWRRRLRVKITTAENCFADNRVLVDEARRALAVTKARLKWEDDAGQIYLDQDVTLVTHNLPDETNAWGTYAQEVEVEFKWFDLTANPGNQECTFQAEGAASAVAVGKVDKIGESVGWTKVAPDKDHRESGLGKVELRGAFHCASEGATQAVRRASLLAQKDTLLAALRSRARGTLRYGAATRTVRVDAFSADIDQEDQRLVWSGSFSWVDFPNQAGYAQAKYTATTQTDAETGDVTLSLSGAVGADTEERARAKLTALRASVAPVATWAPLAQDAGVEMVSDTLAGTDGGDGETFIRLNFSDRYRQTTGDILDWELKLEDQDDVTAGLLRTTYSGTVTARGTSDDAAYTAAIQKARALGDLKYQFRVLVREARVDTHRRDGLHVIRCEFAYEYRRQGTRVYVEMSGSVTRAIYGVDAERVQGKIVGATAVVASTYAALKGGLSGLLREEQVNHGTAQIQQANLSTGALGSTRESMQTEFTFSLELARIKAATDIGMKYEIDVESDWIGLKRVTTVSGTVQARNEAEAGAYLDTFMSGLSLGSRVRSKRSAGNEKGPTVAGTTTTGFLGLTFSETFEAAIASEAQILETSLTEEIRCSGTRRVVQPTAADFDVVQSCGVESGRRTVRGRVVALTEAVGIAWAKRQRALPYLDPAPVNQYATPAEITIEPTFIALTDGVARTGNYGGFGSFTKAGVSAVTVTFVFVDILPSYDPIA